MIKKLVLLSIFFLPFTYALTINVKFPLKIYELTMMIVFFAVIVTGKIFIIKSGSETTKTLFVFLLFILVCSFFRFGFLRNTTQVSFAPRFGMIGDEITEIIYLFFDIFCFLIFSYYSYKNEKEIVDYWLLGAVVASVYTWYLLISPILGKTPFLLPGMDNIQKIYIAPFFFNRSGTFKEGNFMGLYLLLSTVIAMYSGKIKTAVFLGLTTLITFSTIALFGLLFLIPVFIAKMHNNFVKLKFASNTGIYLVYFSVLVIAFFSFRNTSLVKKVFLEKLNTNISAEKTSGSERLHQSLVGLDILLDNPAIGVGLSNYGYYYDNYKKTSFFDNIHTTKIIANNIYVKILSELGLIGFIVFMVFLFRIYGLTKHHDLYYLKFGFCIILFSFMAYPTFLLTFLWAFWALIVGVANKKIINGKKEVGCEVFAG